MASGALRRRHDVRARDARDLLQPLDELGADRRPSAA